MTKRGRPRAKQKKTYHYSFRLSEDENRKLTDMMQRAGCSRNRSRFIVSLIMN